MSRRRMALAVVCVLAVVAAFVVRLIDIQVVSAEQLRADAASKTSGALTVWGTRGDIVDTDGTVLAGSVMRYDITLSPKDANEFDRKNDKGKKVKVSLNQAAAEIGEVTGQTGDEVLGIISGALAKNKKADFAYVKQALNVDQYRALAALKIPWLYPQPHAGRIYPNGAIAGNIVGFVGSDGKPLAGIELMQDRCLAGVNGEQKYKKSKGGVPLPGSTETTVPAKDGSTLQLTINSDLQWFAQQRLAEQVLAMKGSWGVVTITEVKTGKLRAVAEYPSVDPNDVDGVAAGDRGSRAFSTPFEPGSTFKALLAASLIDAGKATPTSQVLAESWYEPENGARIKDSFSHDPLRLTLTGVLAESSNTGISQLGEALSAEQRYNYLKKFGIGTKSVIDFPAESNGTLHDWQNWDNQTFYATMFGQGLSATGIQIANAYQTLGNGGVKLPMSLVEGCRNADGTVTGAGQPTGERVISESAAKQTVGMLESVVTDGHFGDSLVIPGYRVAAKSGTAEQGDQNGGLASSYIVSMTGMAPAENPQYVVSVTIANPTTIRSSAAAAPTFQQIMTQVLKTYRIAPSKTPGPNYPTNY